MTAPHPMPAMTAAPAEARCAPKAPGPRWLALFGSFYRGLHAASPAARRAGLACSVVGVATDDPAQPFVSPHKRVWQYPHERREELMVRQCAEAGIDVYPAGSRIWFCGVRRRWRPDLCIMATFRAAHRCTVAPVPAFGVLQHPPLHRKCVPIEIRGWQSVRRLAPGRASPCRAGFAPRGRRVRHRGIGGLL